MWCASPMSANSACGTSERNSAAVSTLNTSLRSPRTSSTGSRRFRACVAKRSKSMLERGRASLMNCGSQCHRNRPSSPRRRLRASPSVFAGRVRCGKYSATASAASSMLTNPCGLLRMKPTIRSTPSASLRWAMSTSTRQEPAGGWMFAARVPSVHNPARPPIDAPTIAGCPSIWHHASTSAIWAAKE